MAALVCHLVGKPGRTAIFGNPKPVSQFKEWSLVIRQWSIRPDQAESLQLAIISVSKLDAFVLCCEWQGHAERLSRDVASREHRQHPFIGFDAQSLNGSRAVRRRDPCDGLARPQRNDCPGGYPILWCFN